MIKVRYSAVDGFTQTRKFKTLAGAQKFASDRVGKTPEIGTRYAVSGDGIGKVVATGATLAELFPALAPARPAEPTPEPTEQEIYEAAERAMPAFDAGPRRSAGCTCSDQQLNLVGCDCGVEF